MIALKCPRCDHELEVSQASASLGVICPRCGASVPAGGADSAQVRSNASAPNPTIGPSVSQTLDNSEGATPSFAFLRPPEGPDELGRLGTYRVEKLLGQGGMGMVFQAVDVGLQRSVALKVMRPEMGANLEFRQRFLREARATAAIKSDYIVTIHQVGQDNDVPFLAMEFLEGMPLDNWLQNRSRPVLAEVVRIGMEVAHGLWAAHERGLIHRDSSRPTSGSRNRAAGSRSSISAWRGPWPRPTA
jgi:serine/threonine protein kinase